MKKSDTPISKESRRFITRISKVMLVKEPSCEYNAIRMNPRIKIAPLNRHVPKNTPFFIFMSFLRDDAKYGNTDRSEWRNTTCGQHTPEQYYIIFIRVFCIYYFATLRTASRIPSRGPGMRYVRRLVEKKFYCRRNEIYPKVGRIRDRFSCEKFIGRNARPAESSHFSANSEKPPMAIPRRVDVLFRYHRRYFFVK